MVKKYPKNRYLKLSALLLLTLNLCFVNLYATNKTDDSKNHTLNFLNSKPTSTRLWYEINYFEDFSKQIDEQTTDKKTSVEDKAENAFACAGLVGGTGDNDDFDGDGVCNSFDLDDDNDGILDVTENNIFNSSVDPTFDKGTSGSGPNLPQFLPSSGWSDVLTVDLWKDITPGQTNHQNVAESMPNSPQGGVFAGLVHRSGYKESIFTTIDNLVIGRTYNIRFYQAYAGWEIDNIGDFANFEVKFGSETRTSPAMEFLGAGNQVWQQAVLSFTATQASQILTFTALEGSYMAIDGVEVLRDTDNDGIPNRLDTDSDGDGCLDTIEAGTSNDGTTTDANNNGLLDQYEDGTTGTINYVSTYNQYAEDKNTNQCTDTDGDGISDVDDLDDDNDGILDVVENLTIKPALWLDANQSRSITKDGNGLVNQWRDKSGNDRHVSEVTNKPIYSGTGLNSMPTVTFDGINDRLNMASGLDIARNKSALTVLAVFQRTGGNGSQGTVFAATTAVNNFARSALYAGTTRLQAGGRRIDGDGYQFINTTYSAADVNLGVAKFDFGNSDLFVGMNGTYTAKTDFHTAGSTSDTNSPFVSLGQTRNTLFFGGHISELVVIESVDPATIEKIEGYLAHKWGLASKLPSSHPYKSTAYTIDIDGDGIPNSLDTDSDNDGCPDAIEGGANFTNANISNGMLTGAVDSNGVPTQAGASGQTIGDSQNDGVQSTDCLTLPCAGLVGGTGDNDDFDGDGVCNSADLDGDNDGILDTEENFCTGNESESLNYEFYDGSDFNPIDNLPTTGAIATGTVSNFDVNALQNSVDPGDTDNYGIRYTGFITIATANNYTFYLTSDDRSRLVIDGTQVINKTASGGEITGNITLNTGVYPIIIMHSEGGGSANLGMSYSSALIGKTAVPFSILSSTTPSCDTDGDGIPDSLDLDSDGDGCPDALEGGANFTNTNIDSNSSLTGGIDANGVPVQAGAAGQASGDSQNAAVQSASCAIVDVENDAPNVNEDVPTVLDVYGNDNDIPTTGTLTVTQPTNGTVVVTD
ncbi:MAG: hypothetical protein ACI8RP_000619, partial [Urechidicola sp.]